MFEDLEVANTNVTVKIQNASNYAFLNNFRVYSALNSRSRTKVSSGNAVVLKMLKTNLELQQEFEQLLRDHREGKKILTNNMGGYRPLPPSKVSQYQ